LHAYSSSSSFIPQICTSADGYLSVRSKEECKSRGKNSHAERHLNRRSAARKIIFSVTQGSQKPRLGLSSERCSAAPICPKLDDTGELVNQLRSSHFPKNSMTLQT